MTARFDPRDDRGVTLVEVLVALTIGAVVITAIIGVLLVSLKTQDETQSRLDASRDTQLVSTWLPYDVQSAAISGWSTQAADANPCPGGPAGTNVLLLPYSKAPSVDTVEYADYRLEPLGSVMTLVRYQCVSGNSPSRIVVAQKLANSATAAQATITCNQSGGVCTTPIAATITMTLASGQTVTYSSGGRTGTTLGALGGGTTTTTTSPSTTSTSTSTTTTTAPLPCVITNETVTPPSVGRATNGNNADKLASNVTVSVTTSGTCSSVSIRYTVVYQGVTATPTTTLMSGGPANWTATIPGTPQGVKWDRGTYPISLVGPSNAGTWTSATLSVT